jgi:hypothetical protein
VQTHYVRRGKHETTEKDLEYTETRVGSAIPVLFLRDALREVLPLSPHRRGEPQTFAQQAERGVLEFADRQFARRAIDFQEQIAK